MGRNSNYNSSYGYGGYGGYGNNSYNNYDDGGKKRIVKIIVIVLLLLLFLLLTVTVVILFLKKSSSPFPPSHNIESPSNVQLHENDDTNLDVTYDEVTFDDHEIQYDIRWREENKDYSNDNEKDHIKNTEYTISSLTQDTLYFVEVRSFDSDAGNNSEWSNEVSGSTTPTPHPGELPVPKNLMAEKDGSEKINVTYNSVSFETDVIKYDVRWTKTSGGYSEGWSKEAIDGTSYSIIDLTPETTYYVEVRSNDVTKGITSSWSEEKSATTDPLPPVVIPIPSNLKATSDGTSKINVTYDSVSFETDVIKYDVRWTKTSGGYSEGWSKEAIDGTSYSIADLTPNTTYYVEVRSNDITKGITSDWSGEKSAKTDDESHDGPALPDIQPIPDTFKSDWDVGDGHTWKDKVYAPFVDPLVKTVPLTEWSNSMGANYFNLGFIQTANNSERQILEDGTIEWGWGGYDTLNERNGDSQYDAIKSSIKEFRNNGGDVTISFGGQANVSFWMIPSVTVDNLVKTYESIIKGYGLSRIDLDIEGGGENLAANLINAQAIKQVQEDTGVEVVLTLPTTSGGLDGTGYAVAKAYVDAGVDIKAINIMSMYMTTLGGDVTADILGSMDGLERQIKKLASEELGITLTDEQAYKFAGETPSIGYENAAQQPVSNDNWDTVSKYADEKNFAILSDWVENRDALQAGFYGDSQSNPGGIKNQWEYGKTGRNNFNDENFDHGPSPQPTNITGFTVSDKTFNSAKLSWNDTQPSGVKTRIYFAKNGDAEYNLLDTVQGDNSYDLTGLDSESSYWVLLAAVNSDAEHTFSEPINFSTEAAPIDTDPPTWNGSTISIDSGGSSDTKISLSFGKASDNIGIKKYVVTISKDGTKVTSKELVTGIDFNPDDQNISTTLNDLSLSLGDSYEVKVNAYDFSDNESPDITSPYIPSYPKFDYSKSGADTYKVGDIVSFESTDSDWVSAGIGEKLYKKINAWGQGWAPDGSSVGSPDQTSFAPGHTDPDTTGWEIYNSYDLNVDYINIVDQSNHKEKCITKNNINTLFIKNKY